MNESMSGRAYCSQSNPAEPLAGTADTVGAWLLLEYRPVWKARALEDNGLAPRTRAWLADSIAALGAIGIRGRPQFIRQPEVDSDQVRFLFGLPGRLLAFSATGYDFLEGLDLAAIARDPSAHGAAAVVPAQYFVCTNGQRDVCCARLGLPSYAALRERVGDRAWQVTHLGGHRYAPNVLVLPQGALYGRVTLERLPAFVDAVEAGELAFPNLRGRTWHPQHVQAAEAFAGRSDLRLLHVDGDLASARVRFAAPDTVVEVGVARAAEGLAVLASCGAESPELVHPYLQT
jgi:(2Fe-2S) ferredoxin